MILLTVGTQLPFDRLIRIADELAPTIKTPIFAQSGTSSYHPKNIEWAQSVNPKEFEAKFKEASVIVAHAGIGTILTAQRLKKPIILFPREVRFGEHRNDHQLATCKQLEGRPGIYVAQNAEQLVALLTTGNLSPAVDNETLPSRISLVDNIANLLEYIPAKKRN